MVWYTIISSGLLVNNIVIPWYTQALMLLISFSIPIFIIEWVMLLIVFHIFKLEISFAYSFLITLISNLFSTLCGFGLLLLGFEFIYTSFELSLFVLGLLTIFVEFSIILLFLQISSFRKGGRLKRSSNDEKKQPPQKVSFINLMKYAIVGSIICNITSYLFLYLSILSI